MVDFVLNNLRRPPFIVFGAGLHFQGLILNLNGLISLALTGTAEQRQTPLFCIVGLILFEDDRVEHYCVCWGSSAFVKEGYDAFPNTDHIRSHFNARLTVSHQSLKEIIGNPDIFFCRLLGFAREEYRVVHKFLDH